jgi:integrase
VTYKIRPYRGSKTVLEVDISIAMPDGTIHRERKKSPVTSKSGTERWAQAREREIILAGTAPKAPKAKVPTLNDFWPKFIDGHCKANKQKPSGIESKEYHFRQYLGPVLGKLRLSEISNARIVELKAYMTKELGGSPNAKSRPGKSGATINNCLSSLSKCLKCAHEWGVIQALPCKIPRLKTQGRPPAFYDFEPFEALVQAAAALDKRTELIILLSGDAGLRKGEILALDQAYCDTRNGRLTVQWNQVKGQVHETKGMEYRTVPMTDRLRAAIKAHAHRRGPRLLLQDDATPITEANLRAWLAAAQRAAGLPKASGEVHILRHTFCSHLAMRGAPVRSIQTLAGHKHLTTTLRYMHLAPGETDRAIKLLARGTGEVSEKGESSGKKAE